VAGAVVNRLKVLRAERDLSQAALAEKVGVSRQAINTIENGRHDPGVTLAWRIARALGVTIEDAFPFRD
jgi:putative transcriptional regulator